MKYYKVSIIVPVYNIEKYLCQCLESLVNQTLNEIEIICVNDGSTDGSSAILDEYASKDDRIKIINKENAGLGAARNTGMLEVKGEYIGFVDSDDYVDTTMYEKLYNNAKNYDSDMVMCTIGVINGDNDETKSKSYYDLECLDEKFNEGYFNYKDTNCTLFLAVNAYNKIYKSDYIRRIEAKFPEGLIFEDNPFFYQTYLNADKISLVREPLYFHRVNREGSITSGADKRFFDIIKIQNLNFEYFKSLPNYEDYQADFIDKKLTIIIHRYFQVDEVYRQEFFELIKQDFMDMNLTNEELDDLKNYNKRNYLNILKSDTGKEFELLKENIRKNFMIIDLEDLNRQIKKNNRSIHFDNERLRSENLELTRLKTKLKRETKQLKEYLTFKGYIKYKTHNILDRIKYRK